MHILQFLSVCVEVPRGVISTLEVLPEASSSWFHCEATNKLGTAKAQIEFYVSGTVPYSMIQ